MKTLKLAVTKTEYENSINTAAEILKNGGVVAIPTETVYGLAANGLKKIGQHVCEELERFLAGEKLLAEVTQEMLAKMA